MMGTTGIKTNRHGVIWGRGEDLGFDSKWAAICDEHSQVSNDSNGSRIRTLSPMDFCECHMGTCVSKYSENPCPTCGRLPEDAK